MQIYADEFCSCSLGTKPSQKPFGKNVLWIEIQSLKLKVQWKTVLAGHLQIHWAASSRVQAILSENKVQLRLNPMALVPN